MLEKLKKNNVIKLIMLVISIIFLIILTGVIINKAGILNKEKTEKRRLEEQTKENIETKIIAIKEKEEKLNNEVTLESMLQELLDNQTFESIDKAEKIGYIGNYKIKLKFDEENEIVVEEIKEETGIKVRYKLIPQSYTTEEKIDILFTLEGRVKSITKPDGLIIYPNKEIIGMDYYAQKNGKYTFIIQDEQGKKQEKNVIIDTIDKLPPKEFEIAVEGTKYGELIITANTEDAEKDETNVKSGIEKYEYYVRAIEDNKYTKFDTNEIVTLQAGKYNVYAVAYDKAGNKTRSTNEEEVEIVEWAEIWDEEDLRNISRNLNRNYIIMQDIELTQPWIPLGALGDAFTGILEGNNKKITGLRIESNNDYQGLFGFIDNKGSVRNINISNCHISGKSYVGAIAGYIQRNSIIQNVQVTGTIEASGSYAGGIVGHIHSSSLTEAYSNVAVTTTSGDAGGAVGYCYQGYIYKVKSAGNVKGITTIGGLLGSISKGTVSNCYSTGNVEAKPPYSFAYSGGLVGGEIWGSNLINSYSTSKIVAKGYGLTGEEALKQGTNHCYWCPELANVNYSPSGTALTLENMKKQESFQGWDFTSGKVWKMEEFPELIFSFQIEGE